MNLCELCFARHQTEVCPHRCKRCEDDLHHKKNCYATLKSKLAKCCKLCGLIHENNPESNPFYKDEQYDYGGGLTPYAHRNMHHDQVHVDCSGECGEVLWTSHIAAINQWYVDTNGMVWYYCSNCFSNKKSFN